MVEDDRTGVKPMYRNREWNAEERQAAKSKKKVKLVEYSQVKNSVQNCSVCDTYPRGAADERTTEERSRTE